MVRPDPEAFLESFAVIRGLDRVLGYVNRARAWLADRIAPSTESRLRHASVPRLDELVGCEFCEYGTDRDASGTVRVLHRSSCPTLPPPPVVLGSPCPCECNSGGFCGGCGHAGCGGRRVR